ncbi:Acyl-ACP thioesterase protein [Dioscorea alata]|uniref:Acyl-ACP thioesterase protein n=1 Tax=Dioscorea alata TaxID=55571 RepID=A0ACB7UAK3_DIOAL|nr:Acyl-ACP thioesterase protein [Dioscorea alata]
MVASIAASAFLPAASSSSASSAKPSKTIGGAPESLDVRGIVAKPASLSSGGLQVKANAQVAPKINGTKISLKTDTQKAEDEVSYSAPRTFYNQLPDWSMLLAAITTIFLAAEKQWTLLDWKPKRPDMLTDAFSLGRMVNDGLVFKQNFSIRSYEVGADRTASIETLMNHLQETALNHVKISGLMGDGFGATQEMSIRNLIWVVTKMQVLVERYPTCVWVMMNKNTRRLSKMPEEVRAEIEPYFLERSAIIDEDSRKLPKLDDDTADYIRKGLTPRWGDLDINQHVNNVKYIGWILESAPISILENHELASMTLEYRRECGRDSVLQSLTAVSDTSDTLMDSGIECKHLLRLECGAEIVRGRTEWRPKPVAEHVEAGFTPAESA